MINPRSVSDSQHSAALREEAVKSLLQAQASQVQADARVKASATGVGQPSAISLQPSLLELMLTRNAMDASLPHLGGVNSLPREQMLLAGPHHQSFAGYSSGLSQHRSQALFSQHLQSSLGLEKGIGHLLVQGQSGLPSRLADLQEQSFLESQLNGRQQALEQGLPAQGGRQLLQGTIHDRAGLPLVASDAVVASPSLSSLSGTSSRATGKGVVLVPCRARGMPMDHNLKTAHFIVPEDIEHGAELICSYYACRNSGIKFRFCKYCQVPVAKRNFSKRHMHGQGGDSDIDDKEDDDDEDSEKDQQNDFSEKEASPVFVSKNVENDIKDEDDPQRPPSRGYKRKLEDSGDSVASIGANKKVVRSQKVSPAPDTSERPNVTPETLIEINASVPMKTEDRGKDKNVKGSDEGARFKRWTSLFYERPPTEDYNSTSNWLLQVLEVSDNSKRLENA